MCWDEKRLVHQWGLTDTLSTICTILCANLRFWTSFVRDNALVDLDACAGRNNAGIDAHTIVAQAQNASDLRKVAATLSVVSGAVRLRSCKGPLVAQSCCSLNERSMERLSAAKRDCEELRRTRLGRVIKPRN